MIEDNAEFFVSFSEAGVRHTFEKAYGEDLVTWKEVLGDFLRFLDSAYGYDISGQVEVPPELDFEELLEASKQMKFNFGGTD